MKSRLSCVVSETGPLAWLALLAIVFACQVPEGRSDDAEISSIEAQSRPGIAWHTGSVEAAFKTAKEVGKPIFLYWGAEWCPPCQQLKSTVFRQPEFIERTELFVSVYLDADQEDAQRQAEHFGITGYPTMVVFDSGGEELTRVPGGMNLQQYADVLDLVATELASVANVLQSALAGEPVSDREFRLLAYYHWLLDNQKVLAGLDAVHVLKRLFDRCPSRLVEEKGRLFVDYLQTAAFAQGLRLAEQKEARTELVGWLTDPVFVRNNTQYLTVFSAQIAETVSRAGTSERETVTTALLSALDGLAAEETTSKTDRIYAVQGKVALVLNNRPGAPLSQDLQQQALAMAGWADRVTVDPVERQSAVYAAGFLLETAGLYEEAELLMTNEISRNPSPKYFELLSDLATDQGLGDTATGWMKRAFLGAKGPASRFEFGVGFVSTLVQSTPSDLVAVEQGSELVLDELEVLASALYGRTKTQLQRLDDALKLWARGEARREAVVHRLYLRTQGFCAAVAEGRSRQTCDAFLSRSDQGGAAS